MIEGVTRQQPLTPSRWTTLVAVLAGVLAVVAPIGVLIAGHDGQGHASDHARPAVASPSGPPGHETSHTGADTGADTAGTQAAPPTSLPGGGREIFADNRFLVAYYGTAGTAALGVLGRGTPAQMQRQLAKAGRAFERPGRPVQLVYELIVSIADAAPGEDGDFSHDLSRAQVEPYLRAAHRNHALLLLDIQTGRSDFLEVARRWRWALEDPWVGLALDPEWRMAGHDVPGRVVGHVEAAEVNRTSAWLAGLVARRHLPQKLFVLHQFRTDMVRHIDRVRRRAGLAMVQHVDGFGTPGQKRSTFHSVVRPQRFTPGFKLFYQVDVHPMGARDVFALRPRVRFVSFQ